MSEISKPFPSAPAPSSTSPSRDPRRLSRQENPASLPSAPNALPTPTPTRPRSYGEKLIDSLAGLSTEVSTTTTLKNEYSRARKAQLGLNQQYDKIKNLSQFPAAKDLFCRIRDAQNKDVDALKDQLHSRKENQRNLTQQAAALVDAEIQGQNNPPEWLRNIEIETKSNKLSAQTIREEFTRLKKDTLLANSRYSELQRVSRSQLDELESMKRNQSEDFKLLKKTRDRVEDLSDEIRNKTDATALPADRQRISRLDADLYELKQSLEGRLGTKIEQYLRQKGDPRNSPTDTNQKTLKILEDRIIGVEKDVLQRQNSSPAPNKDVLAKTFKDISSRIEAIDGDFKHLETVVHDMMDLQASKDNLLVETVEDNKKQLEQRLEGIVGKIKAETTSDLEKAMLQVKNENVPTKTDGMASLKESAEVHDQRLQTVETAIGSLEARYRGLTFENLTHHILPTVQRLYPPPPALYGVVEAFRVMQMNLAQISNIPALLAAVNDHSQQLVALSSHLPRANEELNENRNLAEIRSISSRLEQRINDCRNLFDGRVSELQLQLQSLDTAVTEMTKKQAQSEEQSQQQDQSTEAQSTGTNVKYAEEQLINRVKEIEEQIQTLQQKIQDTMDDNILKKITLNHENLETNLQHHVEDLNQQIVQLEDKHKNAAVDFNVMSVLLKTVDKARTSNDSMLEDILKTIEDLKTRQSPDDFQAGIQNIVEDINGLSNRLNGLEQVKSMLMGKFHGLQSPRAGSPAINNDISRGEDDVQSTTSNNSAGSNHTHKKKKKHKRKLSTVSSSPFSSPSNSSSSTPHKTPGGSEGSSGNPFKKRQKRRSLMSLVDNAKE